MNHPTLLKLLLIGEGDFSASLALLRAYTQQQQQHPPHLWNDNDEDVKDDVNDDDGVKDDVNDDNNDDDETVPTSVPSSSSSSSSSPSSISPQIILVLTTVLTSAEQLYATYPDTAYSNLQEIDRILLRHSSDSRNQNDNQKYCNHDCTTENNNNISNSDDEVRQNHAVLVSDTTTTATTTTTTTTTTDPNHCNMVVFGIDACHLHKPETQRRLQQQLQYQWQLQQQSSSSSSSYPSKTTNDDLFDIVLFQYPHLGIPISNHNHDTSSSSNNNNNNQSGNDEAFLRQRHISLLHHYFYAASFLASTIHVTLNVAQYHSWIVLPQLQQQQQQQQEQSIQSSPRLQLVIEKSNPKNAIPERPHRQPTNPTISLTTSSSLPSSNTTTVQLQLSKVIPVQQPFHWIFPPNIANTMHPNPMVIRRQSSDITATTTSNNSNNHYTHTRKSRMSKKYHSGGHHRHYLTKYGYHHVRTITPTTPQAVANTTATSKKENDDGDDCTTQYASSTTNSSQKKKMTPVSIVGSCHYVWERTSSSGNHHQHHHSLPWDKNDHENEDDKDVDDTTVTIQPIVICPICGMECNDVTEYIIHIQHPTQYPIHKSNNSCTNSNNGTIEKMIKSIEGTTMTRPTTSSTNNSTIDSCKQEKVHTAINDDIIENDERKRSSVEKPINHESKKLQSNITPTTVSYVPTIPNPPNTLRNDTNEQHSSTLLVPYKHRILEAMVTTEHVGKRLRWFLQHAKMVVVHHTNDGGSSSTSSSRQNNNNPCDTGSTIHVSKRQAERWIQNQCVTINHEIVIDSSRILQQVGWMVRVNVQPILGQATSSKTENVSSNPLVTTMSEIAAGTKVDGSAIFDVITSEANTKVTIVQTFPIQQSHIPFPNENPCSILVVWKPVGMRSIGSFTNGTLEQYLYHHQQQQQPLSSPSSHKESGQKASVHGNESAVPTYHYNSLSKLDKGCSGLCVVIQQTRSTYEARTNHIQELNVRIQHTFTALIYGNNCPEEWKKGASILLPVYGLRRWKNNKRRRPHSIDHLHSSNIVQNGMQDSDQDQDTELDNHNSNEATNNQKVSSHECMYNTKDMEAIVTLIEHTRNADDKSDLDKIPALSTISIATSSTASGLAQTIGYYLRSNKYIIVGDRMAVQEYTTLPRAVRNRIKQRLCFGCTGVRVNITRKSSNNDSSPQMHEQFFETNHPIPLKWSALYWQQFCKSSSQSNG